jgi:hypothetical protein
MDPVDHFHSPDSSSFSVPSDFNTYLKKLKTEFPEEAPALDRFFAQVRDAYIGIYLGMSPGTGNYPIPISLIASPAAARFASLISEYFRDSITPGAPALKAAFTAAFTSAGSVFFSLLSVGMSMSMPG